ncbi:MAG: putative zinc-binding protein [Methanobacteriaceae archaeon]|jgi:uncharacterized metal-binding protein|uniref:putative zinc-binding protein n=1 Tax=unclassified Methanobrevibacter TaxID=2638681 RepID=UPI0037617CF3|nr:putative zinc-binding protein [Methanobacteriaceae archaeon]
MTKKVAVAACSGMSPNGLITRVSCDDTNKENPQVISICMGATSGERTGFRDLIKKYPIIAVNGCDGSCVNSILKQRNVDVIDSINVNEELSKTEYHANDTSRLDNDGEICVDIIKNILNKKIVKILEK